MAYGIKYMDGFHAVTEIPPKVARQYPVYSAVAISRGDLLVITQAVGYAQLATTLAVNGAVFAVALGTNTAAEASSSGKVSCLAVPILAPVMWRVPVTTNAVLAQATHVGYTYNIDGSEDGLSVAANPTTYYGFRIHEIDISTEAVAVQTDGYAIGMFEAMFNV